MFNKNKQPNFMCLFGFLSKKINNLFASIILLLHLFTNFYNSITNFTTISFLLK